MSRAHSVSLSLSLPSSHHRQAAHTHTLPSPRNTRGGGWLASECFVKQTSPLGQYRSRRWDWPIWLLRTESLGFILQQRSKKQILGRSAAALCGAAHLGKLGARRVRHSPSLLSLCLRRHGRALPRGGHQRWEEGSRGDCVWVGRRLVPDDPCQAGAKQAC